MGYKIWDSRAIISVCDTYAEFYVLSFALDRYPFLNKRNEVEFAFCRNCVRKIKKALRNLKKKGYIILVDDREIQTWKVNMDVLERAIIKNRYGFEDEEGIEDEMRKVIRSAEEHCLSK